ncbi:MAG: hypothetical protein R3C39_04105 [Dehalococcoidia bacterium]
MTPVELQPGEEIIKLSRRHWIVLYPWLVFDALVALVPLGLAIWARSNIDGTVGTIILVAGVLWVAGIAVRAYFRWYRYQNDLWLVTNQRLVDSLKRHWFHHQVASADLIDIEDVSMQRSGVLETMLDFGDLQVQTAGEREKFVLGNIQHPSQLLTIIDRARDESRRELGRPQAL